MRQIVSIQVGQVKSYLMHGEQAGEKTWKTAFDKRPVATPVIVARSGVDGDAQADRKHHGGPDKAVLMYANKHYGAWTQEFVHLDLGPGGFGENLTVEGMTEESVCVGDVYRIGHLVVEVSQPRIPCWKISERWREATLTDRVRATGWTGWYVRVREPGVISAHDGIELIDRPYPKLNVSTLNGVLFHRVEKSPALLQQLQQCDALAEGWRQAIPELRA
ncbi:MOSC domain-containing protein [Alicyclobacillus fastidiosus]|uniref:MOSC domain-containing protein n=1 Tax=Alicyclobacillus fastidiosus TaxID=392011 RepID=A0ABY6ZI77_9BACL|nr:MOSC domain-containing protein [Alicyclobacillus fastidiosus]WAH42615.1 MOSC domain-containing protein [Alicyclobacillus fastidiosus]